MTFKEYIESKFQEQVETRVTSANVTNVSVNLELFKKYYKLYTGASFTFQYDTEDSFGWNYIKNGTKTLVDFSLIGISYSGAAVNLDTIVVTCTNGTSYKVFEEIKFANTQPDKYIILSVIGGENVYSIGQQINYQLTFRTDDPLETLELIKKFSAENSDTYFQRDAEWQFKVLCNLPYKAQAFQDGRTNGYYAEYILSVFCIATKNTDDIKEIEIDGERMLFSRANIVYSTQVANNRKENNELNNTNITAGNLQLEFSSVSISNIFNSKVRMIMFGNLDKDTGFLIKIVFADGTYETKTMRITSVSHSKEKATLPIRTYTFMV